MNTITKYAIRYTCPANLADIYFGSYRIKIWVCKLNVPFELRGMFEHADIFSDVDSCYSYIKRHDMSGAEILDVEVQVPE